MPLAQEKSKLKMGDILTLQVQTLALSGQGVATVEGCTVLIKEGLPGDLLKTQITRAKTGQLEARILQVEKGSADRVTPRCRHFGPCGGCDLQQMAYPAQLLWRRERLAAVLRREAGLTGLPPIGIVAMEEPWGYRSKMEFSFGQDGDRVTLGLHERASFKRIVDIVQCHIAAAGVSELLLAIKQAANQFPLKAYNPKIHQGFWRYAVVRSSLETGHLMLLLVTNDGPREPIDALAQQLPEAVPQLTSLWWGVSTRVSDVAQPERLVHLMGQEALEDRTGKIRFEVRPTNFVQPNLWLTVRIYEEIERAAALTGEEAVYDLYCGMGLIGLFLAGRAKVVVGVESDSENVAAAERNASINGITNASFLCGKVEDLLKGRSLFKAGPRPHVVVLDPPRAGLHKEVYAPLLTAGAPTLIYLSCNPVSLARDLKVLLARDPRYRIEGITGFDFFPHTAHLEVLLTLRRRV